ncbi:MAG: glycosyltransferase [Candidatus Microgenomates bacterium]
MPIKIIHYCWFGNKKKPKFFNKIKNSWKKFLPDFKITEWNEKNFNVEKYIFTKTAYKNKKYAFVSDIARLEALYKYGGLYLDIDMEIIQNIDFLLKKTFVIGSENNIHISGGIILINEKYNPHIKNILNIYKKIVFNKEKIWQITLPQILTNYFKKIGFRQNFSEPQILENKIYIYPREYFYPLSYTYENNQFTKKTCMIHHFYSSWTSLEEKTALFFVRKKMSFLVRFVYLFFKIFKKLGIYHD